MNRKETVRYHLAKMVLEDVPLTPETLGQLALDLSTHPHEGWTRLVVREWAIYTAQQNPQTMEVMFILVNQWVRLLAETDPEALEAMYLETAQAVAVIALSK